MEIECVLLLSDHYEWVVPFYGNRQISRRMDTHGIIVVERFATFHYY